MCEPAPLSPTCRAYASFVGLQLSYQLLNPFKSVIPMLIKLELKTTLVLGLYKLSVLAIVRLLSSSQILFPPPPRFTNAQLLQEKE